MFSSNVKSFCQGLKGVQRPESFSVVCFYFCEFRTVSYSRSCGKQVTKITQSTLVFGLPLKPQHYGDHNKSTMSCLWEGHKRIAESNIHVELRRPLFETNFNWVPEWPPSPASRWNDCLGYQSCSLLQF